MKKIFLSLLFILLTGFINFTHASSVQNKVDNILVGFYQKLDKSTQDNNKKIKTIENIVKKIEIIKSKQWDKLKTNDKRLIIVLEVNLKNKIKYYEDLKIDNGIDNTVSNKINDDKNDTLSLNSKSSDFIKLCNDIGEIIYTDKIGTEIGRVDNKGNTKTGNPEELNCNGHIIVCNGKSSGYIIQACNVGVSSELKAGTGIDNYGNYYQFGKKDISWTADWKNYEKIEQDNNWGVNESVKNTATWENSSLENKTKMKGPCSEGYHIPTWKEWKDIYDAGLWNSLYLSPTESKSNLFVNVLKLPIAGYRSKMGGDILEQGKRGFYWSSSSFPDGQGYTVELPFFSSISTSNERSFGMSVRCIKNNGIVSNINSNNNTNILEEDNIISGMSIENGNKIVFDKISGDKFKYLIYMDGKLVTWETDYKGGLKNRGNDNIYSLEKYNNGKYNFEIKAYRWLNNDFKFITSITKELEITNGVKGTSGDNLNRINITLSKYEIILGEEINLSYIGLSDNGNKYKTNVKDVMIISGPKTSGFLDKQISFLNSTILEGNYNNIKFIKPGIHEIQVCLNNEFNNKNICGKISINVKDNKKQDTLKELNVKYDLNNKITWDKDENVEGYEIIIKDLTNPSNSIKNKLSKNQNYFIFTENYDGGYTNKYLGSDLEITITGYIGTTFITSDNDIPYKELSKGNININYFYAKADLPDIQDCSTHINGITYKIEPCLINIDFISGGGDINFVVKIIPTDLNKVFSFSTRPYMGFPLYSLSGVNGGAKGITEMNFTIRDKYMKKGLQYEGEQPIYISDSGEEKMLKLGIKINVK